MELRAVMPFLIPGVLFQLSIQVFYIRACLKDLRLVPAKRRIYVVMMAVSGLPAVAVYLLNARDPLVEPVQHGFDNTTPNTRLGIFLLLVTAYEVMGLHMLAENAGASRYAPLLALLTASFLTMLLYNLLPVKSRFGAGPLLPVLQLALCVPILYLDISGDNLYLALIAGISAINHAPMPQAKIYGIGALGAYLLGSTARSILLSDASELGQLVQYFFVNTLVVLLALVAFYTLKKQMVTSARLEAAFRKLEVQSEQLKELAVISERNRMAAELHDTVGHTLTAAVLSLEAAEGVMPLPPEATQKLQQGKELVRRGLSELRASVRAVRAGNEPGFAGALDRLLTEIRSDTGLDIQLVMESEITLQPLQSGILLSAVKECATNAVKHGRASRADILLGEHRGQLRLTFTDNGVGTTAVRPGSGLSIMGERMQSVGGTLEIETAPGEGFTVSLMISAEREKEDIQ